jgi:hypothetical protein
MRPLSITTVRGEKASATRLFCSTRTIDSALSSRRRRSTAVSASTITGARPSVGSFKIRLQRVDMANAQAAYDYVLQV